MVVIVHAPIVLIIKVTHRVCKFNSWVGSAAHRNTHIPVAIHLALQGTVKLRRKGDNAELTTPLVIGGSLTCNH